MYADNQIGLFPRTFREIKMEKMDFGAFLWTTSAEDDLIQQWMDMLRHRVDSSAIRRT